MLIDKINTALLLASDSGGEVSPFDLNVELAIWTLIIFVGLLLVLRKFAWKPIIEGLDAREKRVADNIDSAQQANEKAVAQLKAYEDKLALAGQEGDALIAVAKTDALAAKEKIMAEAGAEAQRTRDRAVAEIEAAKNAAVRELAESSANSAVALAGSIVGRTLDKSDHARLIEQSIEQFGSGA